MNQTLITKLAVRLTTKNYLDLKYFAMHMAFQVVFSSLWLLRIDSSQILFIALAATVAVLSEAPILILNNYLFKRYKNIVAVRISLAIITMLATSIVFVIVFYALSPSQYVQQYGGYLPGTVNQFVALLYLYFPFAYISESLRSYKSVAAQSQDALAKLKAFEQTADERIRAEESDLKKKVQSALLPSISSIRSELAKKKVMAVGISEQIQDTLKNTVKPLGYNLRNSIEIDNELGSGTVGKISAWGSVPKRFSPREAFSATFSAFFLFPLVLSSSLTVVSKNGLYLVLVQSVLLWVLLELGKLLLPRKSINAVVAFIWQQVIVFAGLISVSLFGYLAAPGATHPFEFVARLGVLVSLASIVYTYASFTERAIRTASSTNQAILMNLDHSRNLLSQRLWIAKRNWSYLVHGRVQAHLLAARVLCQQGQVEGDDLSELLKHLDEVIKILKRPPRPDADLLSELKDLEETWRGIAEFDFEFSPEAKHELAKSSTLRFATNEILREATSNAVKHSNATRITMVLTVESGELKICVSNNGSNPVKSKQKSLGSQMLDELTTNWSLKVDKKTSQVALKANLAL